ncbi:MAG: hypothetical protein M1818_006226 [Claussenomyces sp. TS43310]|nr:MAG: hypothetical protein M1818_006226 [Claussenomyces sp. TS43310]
MTSSLFQGIVASLAEVNIILTEDERKILIETCEVDIPNGILSRMADQGLDYKDDKDLKSKADEGLNSKADEGLYSRANEGLEFKADEGLYSKADEELDLKLQEAYPDVNASMSTIAPTTSYQPSNLALAQQGLLHPSGPSSQQSSIEDGTPSNYKGMRKRTQKLPPQINCSVWIVGIHPDATYADLFAVITVGKVVTLNINDVTAEHQTKAAQLQFATPASAARLYAQASMPPGILVRGLPIKVIHNRNGDQKFEGDRTRVLLIKGPAALTTFEFFDNFFWSKIYRHDDVVQYLPCLVPGYAILEWRFGRVLNQAEGAKMAIEREPAFQGMFEVRYGHDPCDTLSDA